MALSATEEYIESSYFADDDYVGGVADGVVIMTPYFEESSDYIETGYVLDEGVVFSISAALEIAIIEGSATLVCSTGLSAKTGFFISVDTEIFSGASASSAFTMSITSGKTTQGSASISGAFSPTLSVSVTRTDDAQLDSSFSISTTAQRYRTDDALLTWQADLDASAAKTVAFDSTQSVQSSINIDAEVIISAASNFVSTFSQTATALNVILAEAQLDTEFTSEITGIEYILRGNVRTENSRPLIPADKQHGNFYGSQPSHTPKFGSYSSPLLDNNSNYLEYQDSILVPNNTDEWVFETWYYSTAITANASNESELITIAESTTTSLNDVALQLQIGSNINQSGDGYFRLWYDESDGTNNLVTDTTEVTEGSWHHIMLAWKPGTGFKVYLDGSVTINESFTGDIKIPSDPSIWIGHSTADNTETGTGTAFYFLDETRVLNGSSAFSDANLTFSNSSVTVPTSAFSNNTSTKLLLHYENDLRDDDTGTQLFSANLSSTISQTADAQKIVSASAELDAFYSQVSVTGFVSDFFVNADAAFGQTADVNRTRPGSATINSSANTNIDINVVAGGGADILSTTTISTTGDRIRFADSDLNSNINISVSGNITGNGSADLSSAFNTNIDIERIRPGSSTQNTEFTADITGIKAVNTDATLNTAITIAATPSITRGFDADLSSTGSILTAAGRISDFFVNADVNITISADADITAEGTTTLETVAGITSTPSRTRGTDSTLEVAGTLEIGADTTKPGNATLNTAFDFDIDDTLFKTFSSTQSSAFALSIAYTKISPFSIDMDAAFGISSAGDRTRAIEAELTSAANINISTGVVYEGAATLPGFAAIISVNKILHLDQYIYNIDSETREYRLASESRVYRIPAENRIYKIKGA